MRNILYASLCAGLGLAGLIWRAEARVSSVCNVSDLVYNPKTKVYQHLEQTQFANHSLEQKMLTIQFITRHENLLAAKELP